MIEEVLTLYKEALIDTDHDKALSVIRDAVRKGISPEDAVFKVVVPCMEWMAKYLYDTLNSNIAQHFMTAQISADVCEEMISSFKHPPAAIGTVVVGTSPGDVHSFGKRILIGCLKAIMIDVVDLGLNVAPERFVDEAVAHNAQVIAISSMMLHTARGDNGCLKVRQILKERGLQDSIKIIVGGAPYRFDPELYIQVGADACAPDALAAGRIITGLIKEALINERRLPQEVER
ncbi:MAG: cobalamin-dependent protein [Nitrospirae bacterium]|nr:cobalamin-dependent protein [Nitrospirota bacterium]